MYGTFGQICLCSWDSKMQEIPASNSFAHPLKIGFLLKLTGKGWLYSGTWKKRYCVLDGSKFYFYENEHGKGTEKSCGVINLDYYDLCEEYDVKDKNAFVVGTSVRGFFENRHQFAADSVDEMLAWMRAVQEAIAEARLNRRKAGRKRHQEGKSPDLSSSSQESDGTISTVCLVNATKDRAKGPQGRRLPQRKSMMPTARSAEDNDIRQRSISLTTAVANKQENGPSVNVQKQNEGKWLSLSMDEMDRDPADLQGEDMNSQRSNSTFDLPLKQDKGDGDLSRQCQKKVLRFGKLGGQHAALTKELEMRLKIGPGGRRRSSEEEDETRGKDAAEDDSQKKIETLSARVELTKDSIGLLEEKINSLTTRAQYTSQKTDLANSQADDVIKQVASSLKEAEKITEECKQALADAEQARSEYQLLTTECRKILAKLENASEASEERIGSSL